MTPTGTSGTPDGGMTTAVIDLVDFTSSWTQTNLSESTGSSSINSSSNKSSDSIVQLLSFIIMIPLMIWVIAANSLILVVLRLSPELNKKMYIFIKSLAAADLFAGLAAPVAWYLQVEAIHLLDSFYLCVTVYMLLVFPMLVSVLNLLAVACDRYLAILHPLHYERLITIRRAHFFIFLTWIYSLLVASMPYFRHTEARRCDMSVLPADFMLFAVCFQFLLLNLIMCVLYGRIYVTALYHVKRRVDVQRGCSVGTDCDVQRGCPVGTDRHVQRGCPVGTDRHVQRGCPVGTDRDVQRGCPVGTDRDVRSGPLGPDGNVPQGLPKSSNCVSVKRRDAKATKVVALILGVFCTCWTPLICFIAFRYIDDVNALPTMLGDFFFVLAFTNSGMNFVIYSAKNSEFRRALSRLLRRSSSNAPENWISRNDTYF